LLVWHRTVLSVIFFYGKRCFKIEESSGVIFINVRQFYDEIRNPFVMDFTNYVIFIDIFGNEVLLNCLAQELQHPIIDRICDVRLNHKGVSAYLLIGCAMDSLFSNNISMPQGCVINSSSSSKVQMKIQHNFNYAKTESTSGNQSLIPRADQSISGEASFDQVLNSKVIGSSKAGNGTERWAEYTIKAGDTIWDLAVNRYHVDLNDIIRDNNIQDPRKIQPGDKIRIRLPSYPTSQIVTASWYGADYHGKAMANGDLFNMYAPTIAHKHLPLGTRVELENKETGVKVKAVVTDRGPFIEGRDVDLSYGLARMLSIDKKGVGKLIMRVIG
jgi:LysM repeat protein